MSTDSNTSPPDEQERDPDTGNDDHIISRRGTLGLLSALGIVTLGSQSASAAQDHDHFGERWEGTTADPGLDLWNHADAETASALRGQTDSTDGTALVGHATAESGNTRGVVGRVTSPDGYGLYTPDNAQIGGALDFGSTEGYIRTNGGSDDTITLWDTDNSQDILRAQTGGNVEVPAGHFDLATGNRLRLNGAGTGGEMYYNGFENRLDSFGGDWSYYDGVSRQYILRLKSEGTLELPNGNLDLKENALTNIAALFANSNWAVTVDDNRVLYVGSESSGNAGNVILGHSSNQVTDGKRGGAIGGGGYDDGSTSQPNRVTDHYGTVGGGQNNRAGSGDAETTTGEFATVPGGRDNTASGAYSLAGGRHATAQHDGTVVFGDSTSTEIRSQRPDEFRSQMPIFAPSIHTTSARAKKHAVESTDPETVLDSVTELDISTWSYDSEPGVRHMGPMAGEFHAAFGLGPDDDHIATVDADGVALAAIQGLATRLQQETDRIGELERDGAEQSEQLTAFAQQITDCRHENETLQEENTALRERVTELEARLSALEDQIEPSQ